MEFSLIWSHFEDYLSGVQNVNTRTVLGDALQSVKELTRFPSFIYHQHNLEEYEVIREKRSTSECECLHHNGLPFIS
jgi:hypothetical protein